MIGFLQIGSIGGPPAPLEGRCSCLGLQELGEAISSAEAVFLGTVTRSSEVVEVLTSGSDGEDILLTQRSVELRVLSAWKGIDSEVVEVRTGLADGDCGFPFQRGTTYLVFARSENRTMTTSICARTAEVRDALPDLVELGRPAYSPEHG